LSSDGSFMCVTVYDSVMQWEKYVIYTATFSIFFKMSVFCNFLHDCLTRMSSKFFRSDYERLLIARIIIGIAFIFTLNMRSTLVTRFCTAIHTFVLQCILIGWHNEAGVQKFSTNLGSTSEF